jgi:hypothetical protein
MALFFDKEWFDARLAATHLARGDVARALGLSDVELAEVWKDQRELSARDVNLLAALFAVTPHEIAHHAGISTPVPKTQSGPTLAELSARLERVEVVLNEIKTLLLERSR